LEVGRILAGKYRIEGTLGTGGMGAVYVGRNLGTRKAWAIKVLHPEMVGRPEMLQRFLAEAQAAGLIGHPGIVEVIDLDRDGDLRFLVMPKLEGEELATRIARERPLPVSFVMRIGADVADAIEAAHRAKIIHRDLKPGNIFLARENEKRDVAKILDFGIAKLIDPDVGGGLTQTTDVYGTPQYMSPEQLRSAKDVDGRSDIYAIGVILYQALTGRLPFEADSLSDLIFKIRTEAPPRLTSLRPDIPLGLAAIVERAMARDRDARFRSAAELRDALLTCAGTATLDQGALATTIAAVAPPDPSSEQAPTPVLASRRSNGKRAVVIGGVAIGLALSGVGLALFRHSEPSKRRASADVLPQQANGAGPSDSKHGIGTAPAATSQPEQARSVQPASGSGPTPPLPDDVHERKDRHLRRQRREAATPDVVLPELKPR
jgi:serine/threonine-protein kinase